MIFSRFQIDNIYYNVESIQKLYLLLSQEFTGTELIWKKNFATVKDPSEANRAKITINGKALFIQNSQNDKGVFVMKSVKGKEKKAIEILTEAGYAPAKPDGSIAALCTIIAVLLWAVASLMSDAGIVIAVLALIAFLGLGLYYLALTQLKESKYTLVTISSIIFILGFCTLFISSLLLIPMLKYINLNAFYTLSQTEKDK